MENSFNITAINSLIRLTFECYWTENKVNDTLRHEITFRNFGIGSLNILEKNFVQLIEKYGTEKILLGFM